VATDTEPITVTAVCEAGRCHLCRGTVVSLTAAHGRPCECEYGCHQGDDARIERELEAAHWEEI
jgi:hypothetical protein